MIMIIGGAYQGKLNYTRQQFGIQNYTNGSTCTIEDIINHKVIDQFHEFIKRQLKDGNDVTNIVELIMEKNEHAIIICDEIGYGLVPMDAFDRSYRETVGRVCTRLAQHAREVHRVTSGIGSVIKREL